jgi:nitric oxide reductase NorD protein
VIDIAREALIALTEGVSACGDQVAVHSFSSLRRDRVFVRTVKSFDERVSDDVRARIAALKPGFYTRIGAAVRHCAKPNDVDHYEGRYGIEDTRRAVVEARRLGLAVFGVTVDAKARAYFPYVFGANGFAIVSRPEKLSAALPLVWQHLVDG